jgi:hypothetical protein
MTSLAELLAPIPVDTFIRDHLDRHTIKHLKGTQAKAAGVLDWTSLSAAFNVTGDVRPEAIVLRRNGYTIPLQSYTCSRPGHPYSKTQVDLEKVDKYLREGATLVLNRADEIHDRLRHLCAEIEQVVKRSTWANVYAVWGDIPGGTVHFDPHDVIVLQVCGRKHWRVYEPSIAFPICEPPTGSGPKGDPVWDGNLVVGDLLFVPRGWWHLPLPCGEPSIHVTFGIERFCGLDVLRKLAEMLKDSALMRRGVPCDDEMRQVYTEEWCETVTDFIQSPRFFEVTTTKPVRPITRYDLAL